MISDDAAPRRRPRDLVVTATLLLVGLAGPFAYAVAQPAYSTGDEMAHVDYAYQIWTGQLPSFFDGLVMTTDVGIRPSLQWVSQHPPLFYALLAPIVGPLVSGGHPVVAVMLARGALVVLAALSVLAVRWMVRGAFPAWPHVATAAALIYALSSWFPRQGGSIYNDLPAVLAITLATGFLFRALRDPSSRRFLVGFGVTLAAASLVRFSVLPLAVILIGVLAVHRALVLRSWWRGVAEASAMVAAIVLASGWWWWRNLQVVGNLQGSQADFWIERRGWSSRSLTDVVTSDFWQIMLQQFFSTLFMRPNEPWVTPAWWGIWLLFLLPLALGLVTLCVDLWQGRRRDGHATRLLVVLCLVGLVATVVATQVYYRMSSGSALPRYFFAMIPSAAAIMAVGLARWRGAGALLVLWVGARLVAVGVEVDSTLGRPLRGPQADLYPELAWLAFAAVVLASVVVVVELLRPPEPLTTSTPADDATLAPAGRSPT